MPKMFTEVFSTKATDPADTSNEFEPVGGDSTPPDGDGSGDEGPPPEVASEYQPLGGDPVDPGDPVA